MRFPLREKPHRGTLAPWLLCLLGFCWHGVMADSRIAVLYPGPGAFTDIFENIMLGIADNPGIQLIRREIRSNESAISLQAFLDREQVDSVISLGHEGYTLARQVKLRQPLVAGAALLSPDSVPGISLVADPQTFFYRLQQLTPSVKRVYLIYRKGNSDWLIPLAEQAAHEHALDLQAFSATDAQDALRLYLEVLSTAKDSEDAIWLPLDIIASDKSVIPLVMETAWKKKLVVFSNNPAHVKRGALFALIPDHRSMGKRLAEMALTAIENPQMVEGVSPLKDLKTAVNLRTAAHLGIHFSAEEQRAFSLTFQDP